MLNPSLLTKYIMRMFYKTYSGECMQGKYFPLVKERRHFKLLLNKKFL